MNNEVNETGEIPLNENELKQSESGEVREGVHASAPSTLVPNPKDKIALFVLPLALLLSLLCLILNAPHCFEKHHGDTYYNGSNIVYTILGALCSLILIYVMVKRRKRLQD